MATHCDDVRFKVYRRFNDPTLLAGQDLKRRLHTFPQDWFASDSLPDRLATALSEARVIHLKELLESFEFFYRVRRRLRRPTMVELCAGHGLVGILFALCEPTVTRVELTDAVRPKSQATLLDAVGSIAPWVVPKVRYREQPLTATSAVPPGAGVLAVHACGELTDLSLAAAMGGGGPVAVMPCCYGRASRSGLPGLRRALSREIACDVARTYRLHEAGQQVDWTAVPRVITPKNRILVGSPIDASGPFKS